jgi:hypothetical protein
MSASDLKFVTKLIELLLLPRRKFLERRDALNELALPIVETIRHPQLCDPIRIETLAFEIRGFRDPPEKTPAIGTDFFCVMRAVGKQLDPRIAVFAPGLRATN